MTEYGFSVELSIRFRDLDAVGHVNNAVYATYIEQARIDYLDAVIDESFEGRDMVVARLEIDFEREVRPSDDAVTVAVRVPRMGESSFEMEYRVTTGDATADDGTAGDATGGGATVATGRSVQVAYDPEAGRSRPLPDSWRSGIADHEGLDAEN